MNGPAGTDQPTEPLLKVTGLSKTFVGSSSVWERSRPAVRAVDDVSFEVRPGETLGLVGETGSGKSTLGRLVLRLIEPTAGSILFAGREITELSPAEVRRIRSDVQMVFQDPYGSLDPRMTVRSLIAEPMRVHGLERASIPARTSEIMQLVGLDPQMADRYPHQFSGGQRQRIGIARAMAVSPKLLVLDEPVSALDVSIQAQILNLLRDIQKKAGVAYLFIAHDLAVVRHISHRVAVLYLGRIVELTSRDALYERPRHPYTAALLSAVPVSDPKRERQRRRIPLHGEISSGTAIPGGCRFHPRCFLARHMAARGDVSTSRFGDERLPSACVDREPQLADKGNGHLCACHFDASDASVAEATGASTGVKP